MTKKKRIIIGGIAIFLAVFSVIWFVFIDQHTEAEQETEVNNKMIDDQERQMLLAELNAQDPSFAEDTDVDFEAARKIMSLQMTISDEIVNNYLGGNRELLFAELESFLVEYDFWQDATSAVCTQIITKDYKKNITYVEFRLNDPARTTITLDFDEDDYSYTWNFY